MASAVLVLTTLLDVQRFIIQMTYLSGGEWHDDWQMISTHDRAAVGAAGTPSFKDYSPNLNSFDSLY